MVGAPRPEDGQRRTSQAFFHIWISPGVIAGKGSFIGCFMQQSEIIVDVTG
jgi:hypothetical protein